MFAAALNRPAPLPRKREQQRHGQSQARGESQGPSAHGPIQAAAEPGSVDEQCQKSPRKQDSSAVVEQTAGLEQAHAVEAPAVTSPRAILDKIAGKRIYEVVVCNFTGKSFELQGQCRPALRKVPEGRLLSLTQSIAPAPTPDRPLPPLEPLVRAPNPSVTPLLVARAAFKSPPAGGEVLEFTLAYTDESGEGFTVRVNAISHSPIRSDVVVAGQEVNVTSEIQEVSRQVVRPPFGYEAALGVYRDPARCDAARVAQLEPGDEVLAAMGARQGRWLKIVAPAIGWIQAETRDGRPMLDRLIGQRPHLRQVVTVRPRHGWYPEADLSEADRRAVAEKHLSNDIISGGHSARAAEAIRLGREAAALDGGGFVGRSRAALVGVF